MAFKHGKDGAVLFKENAATDYLSAFSMSRDIALNEITNFVRWQRTICSWR